MPVGHMSAKYQHIDMYNCSLQFGNQFGPYCIRCSGIDFSVITALTRNGTVHTLRIKRSLCVHRQSTNTLLRSTTTITWCVINHISDHDYTLDTLHNIAIHC